MTLRVPVCPQCQQPVAPQRTCVACGYIYPRSHDRSPLQLLIFLLCLMPVLVVATLFLRYVFLPVLTLIFSV